MWLWAGMGRDLGSVGGEKIKLEGGAQLKGRGSGPSSSSQGSKRRRTAGGRTPQSWCRICGPGRKGGDQGLELGDYLQGDTWSPSGQGKLLCGPATFL